MRSVLLGTVLRGLRSRLLLSAGSVLLTALAIGSAVLGPVFQSAVTNSYLVTRLGDAPNALTGLSWVYRPDGSAGGPAGAITAAADETDRLPGVYAPAQTMLWGDQVEGLGGLARLAAKVGQCDHLQIEGACPEQPGEVLMLRGDADDTDTRLGDDLDLAGIGTVTVVGTYAVPEADEADWWFDLSRFASFPPQERRGASSPYMPAPLLTVQTAFEDLPADGWTVLVDRRLDAPPDLTLDDLGEVQDVAEALPEDPVAVTGGTLTVVSINDIGAIVTETRDQQATARASVAPAVLSLVLVALALLLRLLMAAADLRLPELALASLRGLPRRRMWLLGLSEPLTVLALSVPVGAVLGIGSALVLVRTWLIPGLPLPLPWTSVVAGLLVAVGALAVAVVAVGLVLRVTLSEQLSGVRRPQRSRRSAVVLQLALVAAAIAVLASKLSAGASGDPDLTDLVLPVLLAVVAGLATARATAVLATWWTRTRSRTRSLSGFVAARAISRRQEGTLVILPVTAAIAICVFGAGVYDSAGQWRASVAATAAPAQVIWTSPLPLDGTVGLTRRLDPEGQWLMAASTVRTTGPSFVAMDTSRLTRVGVWSDQWTPGFSTEQITEALRPRGTVPELVGGSIGLTVTNDAVTDADLTLRVRLVVPGEDAHFAFLGPYPAGQTYTNTQRTPYCRDGCRVEAITVGGPAALPITIQGSLTASDLTVDGELLEGAIRDAGWSVSSEASSPEAVTGLSTDGEQLEIEASSDKPVILQLTAGDLPLALPVVQGVDATTEPDPNSFSETSSLDFEISPVRIAASVPLLGPRGLLIDYDTLSTNRLIYDQENPVYVFARADTPDDVRQGLLDRGLSVDTTLAEVQGGLDQSAYALALRLYAVVALLVLLMAVAALAVSTAVQLPSRRRDAASLRVVGVPRRAVMSAVVREFAVVLGGTAVAGLAAGSLAQYVVLRTVTLGYADTPSTPALVAEIDPVRLALLAALTGVLFGTVALVSAILTVRGARGSTLRESAR
ncbi:MAG: FtsX-like permease family protein [Actinobacteria bacterium]|uniref:Unannotated protein n=1 Tax=freshwater metagenome TaxID=449393 RepID=A0A6J6NLL9_9ZZZZ|nr:FtsX-like permease family protein [Actinomycetota bacterium]